MEKSLREKPPRGESPPRAEGRPRGNGARPSRWLGLLPALVAVLATLPTLAGDFVFDDALIQAGAELSALDLERILWDNYWGDLRFDTNWRPLPLLTYALQLQVSDGAFGFHLVNVLLHALVAWVAYRVMRELLGDARLASLGACLYAALAIRSEAVAWIVGRAEILAALALLGGWWIALSGRSERAKGWLALGAVTFLGACSKENAVVLPLLALLGAWARRERVPWKGVAASGAAIGLYVLLRSRVLADAFRLLDEGRASLVSVVDNPIHHEFVGPATRIGNALALHGLYLWKTLFPLSLSADYSYAELPVLAPESAALWLRAGATVAVLGGALALFRRLGDAAGTMGVLLFPLGFLVSGNFLFGVGTIFGERLAYFPSLALPLVLCAIAARMRRRGPALGRIAIGAIAVLAAGNVARSAARSWEWRDPVVLNEATFQTSRDSVRARLLGSSAALTRALEAGEPAEAARHFEAALERARGAVRILPDHPRAHSRVGRVLLERAQRGGGAAGFAEAERAYTRALELSVASGQADPDDLFRRGLARLGSARATLAQGEPANAARAVELAHADFDAFLRELAGRAQDAAAMHFYYRALTAAMLADLRPERRADLLARAREDFAEALARDPDQPDVLMQSGLLLARAGDLAGAIERLERGLAACERAGRAFHPAAVSAWSFARELARVHELAGDEAAAARARARARELGPSSQR